YNKILLCNAVLSAGFKLAILFRDAWYALRICQRSSHTDIRMLTEADRQPRKQAYAMRGSRHIRHQSNTSYDAVFYRFLYAIINTLRKTKIIRPNQQSFHILFLSDWL